VNKSRADEIVELVAELEQVSHIERVTSLLY
jgi:hypothetical protein